MRRVMPLELIQGDVTEEGWTPLSMAGVLLIDTYLHSVFWFYVLSFINETNLSKTHIKFMFLLIIFEYNLKHIFIFWIGN